MKQSRRARKRASKRRSFGFGGPPHPPMPPWFGPEPPGFEPPQPPRPFEPPMQMFGPPRGRRGGGSWAPPPPPAPPKPPGRGGPFGGRRPLRHLSRKLDLDEDQFSVVARILSDLKTERAQVAVDMRRAASAYSQAVAGPSFDESKAKQATAQSDESAKRWNQAVSDALREIHAVLDDDQRKAFAVMVAESQSWLL